MCDDKGRVKWLLLRGPGNNGKILDKSKFLLSKVLVIVDGNVTINLCKMNAIGHPHKCVSVYQNPPHTNGSKYIRAHLPVRDIMGAIVGTGTMQPERNFPERDKGNSGKRFLSWLCYTQ